MEAEPTTTATFDLQAYKHELDQLCNQPNDVMPDSWQGHARLLIRESDAVPEHIESKAIDKALAIADSNDVTPKLAATRLIENLK